MIHYHRSSSKWDSILTFWPIWNIITKKTSFGRVRFQLNYKSQYHLFNPYQATLYSIIFKQNYIDISPSRKQFSHKSQDHLFNPSEPTNLFIPYRWSVRLSPDVKSILEERTQFNCKSQYHLFNPSETTLHGNITNSKTIVHGTVVESVPQ